MEIYIEYIHQDVNENLNGTESNIYLINQKNVLKLHPVVIRSFSSSSNQARASDGEF
jgi:hypothetical protein